MITMIKSSCGDMVATKNIDVVGEVEVVIGYEFMIHTCGGSYYWINKDTKEECEKIRNMVIRGISGCEEPE